jgi:hypothetical protein
MEIKSHELEVKVKRRRAILNIFTPLEKGIKIPYLEQFMWTQMKQNYDRHVERMEIGRILLRKKTRLLK